jgi:hypothetical protein
MNKKKIGLFLFIFLVCGGLHFESIEDTWMFTTTDAGCRTGKSKLISMFSFEKTVFAANSVTDSWSFTILPDLASPVISNKFPVNNAINVAIDSRIGCDITDMETGVDASSIVVQINGIMTSHTTSVIDNGYHVEVSGLVWGYGRIITVNVAANDF